MLNAPCLFKGDVISGRAPLYLGLYVDDFVYFSEDQSVEASFEKQLKENTLVDFMGPASHFLGLKFQWNKFTVNKEDHLKVHLSQSAFVDNLV